MNTAAEKQPVLTSPVQPHLNRVNTAWRLISSPRNQGSTLLDSVEFQAAIHQLNKAIQASSRSSLALLHKQRLESIYKNNAESGRRLGSSNSAAETPEQKQRMKGTKTANMGFVARLWKKATQGWSKKRNGT